MSTVENGVLVEDETMVVRGACTSCHSSSTCVWTAERVDHWFDRTDSVYLFCAVCGSENEFYDRMKLADVLVEGTYREWFEDVYDYDPEPYDDANIAFDQLP